MLVESTMPSRTLRAFGRAAASDEDAAVVSAIAGLQCLVGGDLALAEDGVDAGDVLLDPADACDVLLLTGGQLEAQGEQLLLGVGQLGNQHVVGKAAKFGALARHA